MFRLKWPIRLIGILMMITGAVLFSSGFDQTQRIPDIPASGPIGIALIAIGSFLSSTHRTPPAD